MARKFFTEKQRIKDPLLLGVFIALLAYSLFLLGREVVFNGIENAIPVLLLVVAVLIVGFGLWVLIKLQLKVAVTKKGINYQISPLHNKKKRRSEEHTSEL